MDFIRFQRKNTGQFALRDVHMRAGFFEGEVRWKMAAGAETIDARVCATALHLLGPTPLPSYLDVFEANRGLLSRVARAKFIASGSDFQLPLLIERSDLTPFLGLRNVA